MNRVISGFDAQRPCFDSHIGIGIDRVIVRFDRNTAAVNTEISCGLDSVPRHIQGNRSSVDRHRTGRVGIILIRLGFDPGIVGHHVDGSSIDDDRTIRSQTVIRCLRVECTAVYRNHCCRGSLDCVFTAAAVRGQCPGTADGQASAALDF